jgi:hypothetical protein
MSMNALFVQVQPGELSGFIAHPASVERLFIPRPGPRSAAAGLAAAQGPGADAALARLSGMLATLPAPLQEQLAARLGVDAGALTADSSLQKLLELTRLRLAETGSPPAEPPREMLSLDKVWHAVHYLLCGQPEPGQALLSRPVMGGADIGDDDEGFSGYGPARYFTAAEVAEFGRAFERPELESEVAGRFDAEHMSRLGIYPGFEADDAQWALDGFRRLRDFYRAAAGNGRAVVTALV